jgi:predicted N-acyltransferase
MDIKIIKNFSSFNKEQWQKLHTNHNPFLRYEFLNQLELSGCVCKQTGWLPHHIALYDNRPGDEPELLGAIPLYLKTHSYGEYVFDWAWANAFERAGYQYYPKLVAAIPFTPVTGPRILTTKDIDENNKQQYIKIQNMLVVAAAELAKNLKVSSLHWLFTTEQETKVLTENHFMKRTGCQFHWQNNNYQDFSDFLSTFTSRKRKKILQERRYVREAGIGMEILSGEEISEQHWQQFYQFYMSTISTHYSTPYLNQDFFLQLGQAMAKDIVLVFANRDNKIIAGALNFKSKTSLFGRYWGCSEKHNGLHFETCYYTAIEYCIKNKLKSFEAGAQGEHKLSRGFVPTQTYSAHWLAQPDFSSAISSFLKHETLGIDSYMSELTEKNPYKRS